MPGATLGHLDPEANNCLLSDLYELLRLSEPSFIFPFLK